MDQRSASVLHLCDHGRRRAQREAARLAGEVIAELDAFLAGDGYGVWSADQAMGRLVKLVLQHQLDLDEYGDPRQPSPGERRSA